DGGGQRRRDRLAVLVERIGVDRAPAVVLAARDRLLEAPGHVRGGTAALDRRPRGARVLGRRWSLGPVVVKCIFHAASLRWRGRRSRDRFLNRSCSTPCTPPRRPCSPCRT